MNRSPDLSFFFDEFSVGEDNKQQLQKLRLKEGERREVCILFADIKNSTVLGCKLDPEVYQSRMDELMKRFTKCITYYGGFVDKYMGDGIMALFGAKQASEQDTERAILSGLKMIEQLENYNRWLQGEEPDAKIEIRIGVNTGLVVVGKIGEEREGDFTVTGAAVNLAQRMESNSPAGKIMLSHNTMKYVERFFDFDHFGSLRVKGFDNEIDCYTVSGYKYEKKQRWYLRKSVFAGREKELDLLGNAYQYVLSHSSEVEQDDRPIRIVGIKADAGMGKTRLANEFCELHTGDVSLVLGAASGVIHTPFHLFTNMLEREFNINPGDPASTKKSKFEAGIRHLSSHLAKSDAESITDAIPLVAALLEIYYEDTRLRLPASELIPQIMIALQLLIKTVLDSHARQDQPIVVILDDLHWMDDSSEVVLQNLLNRMLNNSSYIYPHGLMIIMMYRHDCSAFGRYNGLPQFCETELEPLTSEVMTKLIQSNISGKQLPLEALQKVKELSLGNPFYLEEWCNLISDMPQAGIDEIPVPPNLNALILSRLDLLDKNIRLLLQKASVIGQEFFVDILNWIEEKLYNPIDVRETLQQLESQAFILKLIGFDYSAYFFKHITTRDVAYKTLLVGNRMILHKLAAEAIETLYPERSREFVYALADHYHKAGIKDKALFYLKQAAEMAQKLYSNNIALELWNKVLSLLDGENIEDSGESIRVPRVKLNIVEILMLTGRWDESGKALDEVRSTAQDNSDLFDCYRLMGILAFRKGDLDSAYTFWDKCMSLAQADNDKLAVAFSNLGIWFQHNKDTDKALEYHTKSLHYTQLTDDALREAKTESNIGLLHLNCGNYEEARRYLNLCLELVNEHQFMSVKSIVLGNLGFMYYKTGELDRAYELYQQKLIIVEKMDDKAELIKVLGNIGNVFREKGAPDKALEYYQQVLMLKLSLGNAKEIGITLGVIADMNYRLNRYSEAVDYAQRAISIAHKYPVDVSKYQGIVDKAKAKLA